MDKWYYEQGKMKLLIRINYHKLYRLYTSSAEGSVDLNQVLIVFLAIL